MDDQILFDLIPDYVLGTLASSEQDTVEKLLKRSAEARAQLAEWESLLLGVTALTTPARSAPSTLTAQFAERLSQESATPAPKPTFPKRIAVWRQSLAMVATLAAVFVLVGITIFSAQGGIFFPIPPTPAFSSQIDAIIRNPATRTYPILFNESVVEKGARGTLYVNTSTSDAVIDVRQLPPLPSDKQYQVWMVHGGKSLVVSGGTFDSDANATFVQYLVRAPASFKEYEQVLISVEPRGGSDKPSTEPIGGAKY
jgi:anti-sigma-K factor RskA